MDKPIIKEFKDAWEMGFSSEDWFYCKKRPIVIQAIKMDKDFTVITLEGEYKGKAGDYLLKGVKGEVYPCRKDIFEETYTREKNG